MIRYCCGEGGEDDEIDGVKARFRGVDVVERDSRRRSSLLISLRFLIVSIRFL